MIGRCILFVLITAFMCACENPTTLAVSRAFSANNLSTVFSDTFSVVTSTVKLDSILTNGSGTVLLGQYTDSQLGKLTASSYMQVCYNGSFTPDPQTAVFDSIALVMPYNEVFTGDTTALVHVTVSRVKQSMLVRKLAFTDENKLSIFSNQNGFYNTSKFSTYPKPLIDTAVKFFPHNDSLYLRMPKSFGAKLFRLAKIDSAKLFTSPANFVGNYFYGLYLSVSTDPKKNTEACVAGFKAAKVKMRLYYHQRSGDTSPTTHADFALSNSLYQFNNIKSDYTGTRLASLPINTRLSSRLTNGVTYVQSGTGIVTRLDFPSLKSYFSTAQGVMLNAVYLQVFPVKGSYSHNFLPPSPLQLYTTDATNYPTGIVSGATSSIAYDTEYGINTYYNYPLFNFVFGQLKNNNNYFTPLIIAPSANQGSSIQRLYIGDRYYPKTKIKLLVYYSFVSN